MGTTTEPDTDTAYTVEGWRGVAWRYLGPMTQLDPTDEDGESVEVEGWSRVVMIGDDRVFEVETDAMHAINEEDYCGGCGQVGCTADGR